jgi:hypothetical protein
MSLAFPSSPKEKDSFWSSPDPPQLPRMLLPEEDELPFILPSPLASTILLAILSTYFDVGWLGGRMRDLYWATVSL